FEDVLGERVHVPRASRQEMKARKQAFDDERDRPDGQHHEAAEEEDVKDARVQVPEHPLLRESVFEGLQDPAADLVEPRLGGSGEKDADAPARGVDERHHREEDEEAEDQRAGQTEENAVGRQQRHGGSVNQEPPALVRTAGGYSALAARTAFATSG